MKRILLPIILIFFIALGTSNGVAQQVTDHPNHNPGENSYVPYRERVWVQTDKSVYVTGEIMWLKAYVTSEATRRLSPLSKICYAELLGAHHKVVWQAKLDLDSAMGTGSFLIPASVTSGRYQLRAYTRWMENFSPQAYYHSTLTIINPNRPPEFSPSDTVHTPRIRFFPEGGKLVTGLPGTVAFQVQKGDEPIAEGTGILLDEKKDTLLSFIVGSSGRGIFSFIPQPGYNYEAQVRLKNTTLRAALPPAADSGWVIHATQGEKDLYLTVQSKDDPSPKVYLRVDNTHRSYLQMEQSFSGGKCGFTIPTAALTPGLSMVTLWDESGRLRGTRPIFVPARVQARWRVRSDEPAYSFRDKVRLNLNIMDTIPAIQVPRAFVSLSVYLIDSLQPPPGSGEFFQTDLLNNSSPQDRDLILLTRDWDKASLSFEDISRKTPLAYLPEVEGHLITGRLFAKTGDLPAPGVRVYLSVPGKDFRFTQTLSQDSGKIRFNVDKFYGSHEIIVQTEPQDSNYRVFIESPFSEKYAPFHPRPLVLTPDLASAIMLRSLGAQARNAYTPGSDNQFVPPARWDTLPFYGKGDVRYSLDDYTRFPTLEEDMRGFVKEVHVRKRDGHFHFEVYNHLNPSFFPFDPLVLIDGVPVFSVDRILAVDPLKIQDIDIKTDMFFQGTQQFDGIVSYQTYQGDLSGYTLSPNSLEMEYEGLQLPRVFSQPAYENGSERESSLPDYRNVLLWQPNLSITGGKKETGFYTSDIPGKYLVVMEGISSNGEPVYATTTFTVKAPLKP
ncbi:MAG: hypothetical protein KGM98_09580 [Bacteroidota bacterium]|nr:hypothetical protein [Bacteroidota bacterium]